MQRGKEKRKVVMTPALMTAEAFWDLCQTPEAAGRRIELIEGEIVEMSPTGVEHGVVTHAISMAIGIFVREHALGQVTAAETGFVVQRDESGTVLAPAVGCIRRERVPKTLPERFFDGAPDVAVEVMSPNDRHAGALRKVRLVLAHGTAEVWVVSPETCTVTVYRADADGRTTAVVLGEADTLEGGAALPGFTLALRALFAAG